MADYKRILDFLKNNAGYIAGGVAGAGLGGLGGAYVGGKFGQKTLGALLGAAGGGAGGAYGGNALQELIMAWLAERERAQRLPNTQKAISNAIEKRVNSAGEKAKSELPQETQDAMSNQTFDENTSPEAFARIAEGNAAVADARGNARNRAEHNAESWGQGSAHQYANMNLSGYEDGAEAKRMAELVTGEAFNGGEKSSTPHKLDAASQAYWDNFERQRQLADAKRRAQVERAVMDAKGITIPEEEEKGPRAPEQLKEQAYNTQARANYYNAIRRTYGRILL